MAHKVALIIMDGWGIADDPAVSAIEQGHTPFYHQAIRQYPTSKLRASEQAVGLPQGQMGNSEVGHMNLGAGRVVFQELERISNALQTGAFEQTAAWQQLVAYCKTGRPLHLMGLVSNGGVHSHINHLLGILDKAKAAGLKEVYVHASTDGRDCDPHSGLGFVKQLQDHLDRLGIGKIASVVGRYFAMDRDKRWGRVRKAYDLIVNGVGTPQVSAMAALGASYAAGVTDEFVEPAVITQNGKPVATLKEGDAVLFFNFRTDRGRQLTHVLTQENLPEYGMHTLPLHYCTLTRYDEEFKNVHVVFEKDDISQTLGEVLAAHGKRQVRIAETEKYPHVTFFFNGGREEPFAGEDRMLCPSPKVATYDLQPEMSAAEVCTAVLTSMDKQAYDFICVNFANPDMVGHTGIMAAAIKACETVDACVAQVVAKAQQTGYTCIILADHGNADKMRKADGTPHTAHTLALVPCILITADGSRYHMKDGKLGDIAPTILTLMGLPIPAAMTGDVLLQPVGIPA